ncbi:MAG TPA: hypothetical protein VH558_02220 [Pseudolabrys sp.]|jgi:hypothetical protein
MTLIVSVQGPDTIWMLADRRLTYNTGRSPRDDARKMLLLEATDGVAILGYAGLGATMLGTEPSDWMGALLRGRRCALEQYLGFVAEAMKKEFPRHLLRILGGGPTHSIIIPSFVGADPRLYSIDLAYSADRKKTFFRYTRHTAHTPIGTSRPVRVALGGTGGLRLARRKSKKWLRDLLRLVRAHDLDRVSALTVADHLAQLNTEVHAEDHTVGPSCIVAWRYSKEGVHKGGGADQLYSATGRETGKLDDIGIHGVPTIACGYDVGAIAGATVPLIFPQMLEAMRAKAPFKLDEEALNTALSKLPNEPDEKLR